MINDWDAAILCLDADVIDREAKAVEYGRNSGGLSHWRAQAKKQIGIRLKSSLRNEALNVSADNILDLIADYEPLRQAAVYLSLHLLFDNMTVLPGDLFMVKSAFYLDEFEKEFIRAVGQISVDLDESGSISPSEEYNVKLGISMSR